MLKSISITNAAVAKQIDLDLFHGFSVITGETGSGKSVMIDCLQLITGAKSSRDIVRSGEDRTVISAIFECNSAVGNALSEIGVELDENGELMILRTVNADGRTNIKINSRSVTLAQLRSIGNLLIGINTQNEKNFLSDKREYTSVLDGFADNSVILEEYTKVYQKLNTAKNELQSLKDDLKEKNMMIDILTYQIKEIESARLTSDDEEDKLIRLRTKIKSIERTEKNRKIVYKALSQNDKGYSAAYLLERASLALAQISDVVEGAPDMIRKLDEYRYEIIEIAENVNSALDSGIDGDPAEKLNQIEARLNLIDKLKRKYGSSIAEIKAFRENAANKLKAFSDSDETISSLEKTIVRLTAEAAEAGKRLHETRVTAAKTLSDEVVATLRDLDMPKVKFYVEVLPCILNGQYCFTPSGFDEIDIKISVNPGEDAQSISKVASGGEMSRVMLALRSSINKKNGAETVIFDEIDAGVSGRTSEKIGLLLKKLSKDVQVISVTHSPQIAAVSDYHYLIKKTEVNGRAESSVTLLENDGRIDEIARIIGGINVTEKQKAAAREMLVKNY
ncbi:MAG: DNA repair protein RecN [Clostridia bacterium]|nr:DNA repair protein RecN [Clostridia bacterium]